jgi:hypothetical protein
VAYDMATYRLLVWDRDGRLRDTRRLDGGAIPLLWPSGASMLAVRSGQGGNLPAWIDLRAGGTSVPIGTGDSLYRALFAGPADPTIRSPASPVVGAWRDGLVIGDGTRFVFGLYDASGVPRYLVQLDLPPRRRGAAEVDRLLSAAEAAGMITGGSAGLAAERQRLTSETVPWVPIQSHPRHDDAGRLWILRFAADDGVAAELFQGEEHLGTLRFGCDGFGGEWALSGSLLALVCAPDDPLSTDDAVIQFYRIREPAPVE